MAYARTENSLTLFMKDARIHIRLSKELKEKFEKKLKKDDITPSEFFRLAIKKYLRWTP